ncbi:MAG: MobF family relaxase [Verrucomicrobiota bacterium]
MITSGIIRNGGTYLVRHLRKNDYWAEGEKEVQGEWIGEGARALGLQGPVTEEPFESLRVNRNPRTGDLLTAREFKHRVAFVDVQLSAPKDVSVLAQVGGDERVRLAFIESVKIALAEMERFAAVRERRGDACCTEAFRLTGNFVGALFFHDASRDLDPQLHAHAVLANATWDPARQAWYALQPAEMLRASAYLRQVLYRELATRLRALGYEPYELNSHGFSVRGVEHLRARYSKRARHVQQLAEAFALERGRQPTKREVEVLVRESRGDKLTEASTPEVRAKQRAELSPDEAASLDKLVHAARAQRPRLHPSLGQAKQVLEAALRHVFERSSVVREGEVLRAALALHPDFYAWRDLRQALEQHPDVLRRHGEMTLRVIRSEERLTVQRVQAGRGRVFRLGEIRYLPAKLTAGQRRAADELLQNRDFVSVLVGDAGTGKTTVLTAIEHAHVASGGQRFVPLAPTTRAREALTESGFASADTVQRFLVSEPLQAAAAGRLILVDEAGLLSTQQLEQLTKLAETLQSRLLLVGDTKQHTSVQRGDALRNVIKYAYLPVVRLSEVLRQRNEVDRCFSRLLAAGSVAEAFDFADSRGILPQTACGSRTARNCRRTSPPGPMATPSPRTARRAVRPRNRFWFSARWRAGRSRGGSSTSRTRVTAGRTRSTCRRSANSSGGSASRTRVANSLPSSSNGRVCRSRKGLCPGRSGAGAAGCNWLGSPRRTGSGGMVSGTGRECGNDGVDCLGSIAVR